MTKREELLNELHEAYEANDHDWIIMVEEELALLDDEEDCDPSDDEEGFSDDDPADLEAGFNPYMGCYDYDC